MSTGMRNRGDPQVRTTVTVTTATDREHRDQAGAPAPQDERARNPEQDHGVPRAGDEDAQPRRTEGVGFDHVQLVRAPEPRRDDRGHASEVVARVGRADVAHLGRALGVVAGHLPDRAPDVPRPQLGVRVRDRAVGAGDDVPEGGGDRHRRCEPRQVEDRPRREHDDRREHCDTEPAPAVELRRPRKEHHRHHEDGEEQERLAATECRERARGAEHDGSRGRRAAEVPVGRPEQRGDEQRIEVLGVQVARCGPEERIDGGDPGGEQPGPIVGHLPSQPADREHREPTDDRLRHLVRVHRRPTEPRDRCEHERPERWVTRRLPDVAAEDVDERIDEAATVGEEVPGAVVPEAVVDREVRRRVREHEGDPHEQSGGHDPAQDREEPRGAHRNSLAPRPL